MEEIKKNMNKHNSTLSEFACKDEDCIRLEYEEEDIRPPYFHDSDRIIFSLSYNRYADKTQVFSFMENDHISRRMTHVQYVSKIARTIGRALNLNEDLIEASALGHDLGHAPFGHSGEKILNMISLENGEGYFFHNIESVRALMFIDRDGRGANLSVQVLDAIMAHNGEIEKCMYEPVEKTKEEFLKEYYESYKNPHKVLEIRPMTLEGCVVRISDIIGYLGRDVEDAIILGYIKQSDLPKSVTEVLGKTNREIVNTLVIDVINNSIGKNYIKLSERVFNALSELKKFNYEHIYYKANKKETIEHYEVMFRSLFSKYLHDLEIENKESEIYKIYLNSMAEKYIKENTKRRIVIDFLAGMTDDFILKMYDNNQKKEKELSRIN